jgi:hypothetical protein
MSELSPGSKATTNLFMVLGILALAALAVSVGNKKEGPQQSCDDRLIQMGAVVLTPGEERSVTLQYTVMHDGSIDNIEVLGDPSQYDEIAIRALQQARYNEASGSSPLTCTYEFTSGTD